MLDKNSNGLDLIITQALEELKEEQGENFSLKDLNLAELERRTGISRSRLRRWKSNGYQFLPHGRTGKHLEKTVLSDYENVIDNLLKQGVSNSDVCYKALVKQGYSGSKTTIKLYITTHKHLIPAKRKLVQPQGPRGIRYTTGPGECFQMDWGFIKVVDANSMQDIQVACFAMICHHCGFRYIEFFPNAKQENLFIGMLHAFAYMGIPEFVLTDNMKSVVIKRDCYGQPIWQKDYEVFMKVVGFRTRLHKPYHPFTKGCVERLIRHVKENFLANRVFWDLNDLNRVAWDWCNEENNGLSSRLDKYVISKAHQKKCTECLSMLNESRSLLLYLCPERIISFDGFINYEGHRFGVPLSYNGRTARVRRNHNKLYIYSQDLSELLVVHDVNWAKKDHFCDNQFVEKQPEEFPTMPVKTFVEKKKQPDDALLGFDKFNFDKED